MRVFSSIFKFFDSHKFIRGLSSCLIFGFFALSLLISFGQKSLGIGERPQIVVLDLSSGSNGSSYPVTYLGSLPNDWNSTEFKTNKVILKWVDPGVFDMGQTGVTNADIVRQITLTRGFYMGIYEITGSQYEKVIGFDPSIHGGDTKPVDRGTWNEVRGGIWPSGVPSNSSFIGKVRQKTNGEIFDLPTEAQWEFVARAGTSTTYFFGDQNSEMSNYAWDNTSTGSTFEVGLKLPNPWGFFDIYGNAREYCLDYAGSYQPGPQVDPVGLSSSNSGRIIRGSGILSTAARSYVQPDDDSGLRGFRILLNTLNAFPNNLVSVAPLNIQENQPMGSVVGEFNATDPDANATLTYHLVSGAGDGNNSLFTLDANGTLTTATVFDFESNASTYSIRVQARDEYNASVEGNFTVTLLDVFESADIQIFSNSSAGVNLNLGPGDYKLKYLSGGYLYATGRYRTHTSFAKNRSLGTDNIFFPGGDYYSVASIQSGLDPKEYDFCIETQSTVSIWHYDASYGDNSGSMWLRVEKVENIPPADLTSINSLVISENQPTGSVIGEFNATDLDANSALTYHLVSGVGDASNSLFTLDQNGTLKTATVFDFETNASTYSIRVQARDDENATVEGNFTVVLTNDIYEDSDGDGFSDFQEASAGTDPNQALSKPGLNFGLVAWYPFDGNASDMSGNGNHGTVNGATLGTDRHGVAGKAYSFDGVDDNITLPDSDILELNQTDHSVGLWFNARNYSEADYSGQILISKRWTLSSWGLELRYRKPTYIQGAGDDLIVFTSMQNEMPVNEWTHIEFVYKISGKTLNWYVNGNFIESKNEIESPISNDELIRIGGQNGVYYFDGSIDDIRIYDRALSAEEIRLLYDTEAELPVQSVTSAKLSPALNDLIDGNGSLEQVLPAGSVIARKPGEAPPPGYTLFQCPEYNASLVWEEKAPISIARFAFDGAEVIDGEIYFTGMQVDHNKTGSTLLERYDPSTDTWETLATRPKVRYASCSAVLNGKYYVMGGGWADKSVEIYDPKTNSWSEGVPMPVEVAHCAAITYEGKIYVIGNNQVVVFDPSKNKWELKAECDLTSWGTALAMYQNRIWSFTKQGWKVMIRIQIRGKLKLLHLLIASLGPHGSTKTNCILHVGEFLIAHPSV